MTYSQAKVQDQQSVGSGDRVETNGQMTEATAFTSLTNAVGNKSGLYFSIYIIQ